jgi:dinuclear metal center YbgI/SA1388 family protein
MSLTVAESVARLAEVIPLAKAAAWDAVGLQVGETTAGAEVVAVCHEVTDAVIDAASANNVDLLIAYHPLLFRPARTFVSGGSASGRAYKLAAAGVALYVVHTAFDAAAGGCADALAASLGVEDCTGFGPNWPSDSSKVVTFAPAGAAPAVTAAMAEAGAGRIGNYTECSFTLEGVGSYRPEAGATPLIGDVGELSRGDEVRVEMNLPSGLVDRVVAALVATHPYEEPAYDVYAVRANSGFVGRVGNLAMEQPLADLGQRAAETLAVQVRVAGDLARPVVRVAVVPGAGSSLLGAAAATGADVLVTGDVSHHRAREALGLGLAVVDAGHAATERPGMQKLYSLVSEMFTNTIDLTHMDPSPWETT